MSGILFSFLPVVSRYAGGPSEQITGEVVKVILLYVLMNQSRPDFNLLFFQPYQRQLNRQKDLTTATAQLSLCSEIKPTTTIDYQLFLNSASILNSCFYSKSA